MGRTGRSISAIRWCSSMPFGSRSATKASCATRRSTSRSRSCRTAPRRFSASGSNRPKALPWLRVVNELKTRGVQDILIAVVDGLKGFPEAINAVFPQTIVQTCIVHLIRHSMDFASWKDRKSLAQGAARTVYRLRPTLQLARPPSTPSRKARGAQNIRPLRRAGVATGSS